MSTSYERFLDVPESAGFLVVNVLIKDVTNLNPTSRKMHRNCTHSLYWNLDLCSSSPSGKAHLSREYSSYQEIKPWSDPIDDSPVLPKTSRDPA
ncbi:hypothetical protein BGZ96_009811 [Linnemannia gamsii]|uniref:Uncharacterized protein n=1 Tax=Linnemannia gamsii TaxID=64522 RepID=A0ABQ7JWC3_9FUNG|nr:hypothetical protein BGZ96_009811 [Linnemannia gamsii]